MKADIAALWAEALESGNYRQGEGSLIYQGSQGPYHCCLGVLCDLANRAGITEPGRDEHSSSSTWNFSTNGATLPDRVRRWAGMATDHGFINVLRTSLMAMNDQGEDFATIAEYIRANVEAL